MSTVLATLAFLSFLNLTAHSQAFGSTETILWNFADGADQGNYTVSGLITDNGGNLYGTTQVGVGNGGTAFELSPSSMIGGDWTYTVLHTFGISPGDGTRPTVGMIMDASGNLYGTTSLGGADTSQSGGGTVFELSPPSKPGGAWTESILWSFGKGTDGNSPEARLLMDKSGNLYGTTAVGGIYPGPFGSGRGTAFELSPPLAPGAPWTESILWSFGKGFDGIGPEAGLIMDDRGNLYGTTICGGPYGDCANSAGGTVFELTPPSKPGGAWIESILWNFGQGTDGAYPEDGLVMDANGNLYGATALGGAYGSGDTLGMAGGTVFELTPPAIKGGNWTESILWSFGNGFDGSNPMYNPFGGGAAGLLMDTDRNLYGTTNTGGAWGSGTAFELTPPSNIGETWTESILWSFGHNPGNGLHGDGQFPQDGLIMDNNGNLLGTTGGGGISQTFFGDGTVFEISPGGPQTPTPTATATRTATATPTRTPGPTPTATPTPSMGKISVSANPIVLKGKSGKPKSKKLKVKNIGTGPLDVTGTQGLSAPLSSSGGGTIASKKSLMIDVTDAPTTGKSTTTQTLKILSNDPNRPEVDISVTGNSP